MKLIDPFRLYKSSTDKLVELIKGSYKHEAERMTYDLVRVKFYNRVKSFYGDRVELYQTELTTTLEYRLALRRARI